MGPVGLGKSLKGRIGRKVEELVDRSGVDGPRLPQAMEGRVGIRLVNPLRPVAPSTEIKQIRIRARSNLRISPLILLLGGVGRYRRLRCSGR